MRIRNLMQFASEPLAALGVVGCMGVGATLLATGMPAAVATALLAIGALGWILALQHSIRTASARIGAAAAMAGARSAGLDASVTHIEEQMDSLRHRLAPIHPVSGLPLRELLIERIERDGRGIIGIIAFADLDRVAAFDPLLADRVFATCSARLRAMMPATRFLAQIDRGHIAVWFGSAEREDVATAELKAVSYAMGEGVSDGDTQIIPQLDFRLASYESDDALAPSAFIARVQASFSLPQDGSAATGSVVTQTTSARDLFTLEQDLRQAIDRRELRLAFQPLIAAGEGRVCGAEALIRWDHPIRGSISPAQFVPVLEAMGLAREIGFWAMNAAVREARRWATQGLGQLWVAVNVSSLQLQGDELPQAVARMLQTHGVRPSQLEIELTESVATSDTEHCRHLFRSLRDMGVKLAVDDFGTGYSGFSSLRQLAFDKIKIDREFVTDVDRRRDSQAICQSIIALGRGLGIRVLAEGVERQEEYEWLRRHGCLYFQGYYFGKPMPGDALVRFAQDHAALARLLAHAGNPSQITERMSA
jgi:EAL domain-containing protein (putative c-di-GMP-specific phosphodiesterase class I)/GGDEF domain-containing protein